MSIARRRHVVLVATSIVAIASCATLRAHEVIVEQIVRITVAAETSRLDVHANIPASLLNDAGLARMDDGRIDATISPDALQAIAVDVARNLDMRKDGVALPATKATAQLGADRQSVNVDVAYAISGSVTGLSARLNAFQGTALRPPRTDVTYRAASNAPQQLTVTGKPSRVSLDPGAASAFRQSAGSAFDQVLNGAGDHLLFLLCLLLPLRPARESARLIGILLAAQAAGIALSPVLTIGVPLIAVQMIASSAVVAAALAVIVGPASRALAGLVILFGLSNGADFGAAFGLVRPFAGAHGLLALMTFTVTALGAESWLAAVILATRRWLDHITVSGGILTVAAAALVAHVAMHRVLDRGHVLEQAGTLAAGHALTLLAVAWTGVMLTVAIARFARDRRAPDSRRVASAAS